MSFVIGGCVGPVVGLDIFGELKNLLPHSGRPTAVTFKNQHYSRSLHKLVCVSYNSRI